MSAEIRRLLEQAADDLMRGLPREQSERFAYGYDSGVRDLLRDALALLAAPAVPPPLCSGCQQPMESVRYRCAQCGTFVAAPAVPASYTEAARQFLADGTDDAENL